MVLTRAGRLAVLAAGLAGCGRERSRPAVPPPVASAAAGATPAASTAAGATPAASAATGATPAASSAAGALELPEVAGFAAAPAAPGDGFVRRGYSRGRARLQVTLARMPMSADDYQRWTASSAGFPQADLGLPASDANGFYQCTEGADPSCDLLVQLRAGFHLEIRGGGSSSRADVDALARGLPLRRWAAAR